ncbi:DUF2141 domain-containing protein [uncultured Jannaschia sp.]|uniref:DUF2141 domain-containing protein n=1 Tax=uncultured Jannaschia sp. TaxID=293347 RepID=UPI00262B1AAE|nr:DUF2141 domain-containing protein [uncultured Jannaschia sp.]
MRFALTIVCMLTTVPATAADLTIRIGNLRSDEGQLLVAICDEAQFTTSDCVHIGRAPASGGVVTIRDVPPGIYAIQAIHDENGNGTLDRRMMFIPLEGIGFSRNARMRRGPPRFAEAAIEIRGDGVVSFDMEYFQD